MQGTECLLTTELAVCFSAAGAPLRAPVIIQCLSHMQHCPQKDLDVSRAVSSMGFLYKGPCPAQKHPRLFPSTSSVLE